MRIVNPETAFKIPISKALARNELGLTARQSRFVREYVYFCPSNGAECARRAGYSNKRADKAAYELLNSKSIQMAIRQEQEKLLAQDGPLAYQCMKDLMMNAEEESVRYKAAKDILDRGGWKAVQRTVVEHVHMTPEQRNARIIELQKQLSPVSITGGVNPYNAPNVIEGVEAEEVEDAPSAV